MYTRAGLGRDVSPRPAAAGSPPYEQSSGAACCGAVVKSLCKCYCICVATVLVYGAFVGRVDYDSEKKKTPMDYFKKETVMEISLFIPFFILGFVDID